MTPSERISSRTALALILFAIIALFAIRATAPHNFLDKDQERPASYILDILVNGHWACQTDWMSDITSKPPTLTWIAALLAMATGGLTPITLFLPSALAFTLLALLVWQHGKRFMGPHAGLFAALIMILSPLSIRLFILLRTDAVFALMVGLTAFAAFRAWNKGGSWLPFWLAAAAATLTKGPFGLILGAGGLLAVFWEKKSGDDIRPLRGKGTLTGIILFLLIVFGWFWLAYLQFGDALIDKIIRRELIDHAVHVSESDPLYERIFKPAIYFIHRILPWSIIAFIGFWKTIRYPSKNPETRRFERFLICWFFVGFGILSVAQHQRADLLAPLLAPAFLLAGRQIAQWTARIPARKLLISTTAVILILLGGAFSYYYLYQPRKIPVKDTRRLLDFSREIANNPDADYKSFHYVDVYYTFQLYLGTMHTNLTMDAAAELLSETNPAVVLVSEIGEQIVGEKMRQREKPYYELATCTGTTHVLIRVLSNRETFPRLDGGE